MDFLVSGRKSATVVIATHNRKDELRTAIQSALRQTAPVEILVMDDGSHDGTAEMVRAEFPEVLLETSANSIGCIVQRNRAARLASGEIIISIDDDAVVASPHTVEQTLHEFDHPRVGAVAIPYVEPHKSALVHQQAPSNDGTFVTDSFVGTAHALRKNLFLGLGGYREVLLHQGEEMDFCIRMLQAGCVVRLGRADPIHHMESARRDFRRMDFYGRRNDILFAWHNVPMPYLPLHAIGTTFNGLMFGLKVGRPIQMLRGILNGYADCVARWEHRKPVDATTYWLSRRLKKHGPKALHALEEILPMAAVPLLESGAN